MIKATTNIGNLRLQIEAKDLKDLFREMELLSQCPQHCACGSRNITPQYSKHAAKGFEFFSLKCGDCGKEFSFGQRKSDGGLFPNFTDGWKEPYRGSGGGSSNEEGSLNDDGGYDG